MMHHPVDGGFFRSLGQWCPDSLGSGTCTSALTPDRTVITHEVISALDPPCWRGKRGDDHPNSHVALTAPLC